MCSDSIRVPRVYFSRIYRGLYTTRTTRTLHSMSVFLIRDKIRLLGFTNDTTYLILSFWCNNARCVSSGRSLSSSFCPTRVLQLSQSEAACTESPASPCSFAPRLARTGCTFGLRLGSQARLWCSPPRLYASHAASRRLCALPRRLALSGERSIGRDGSTPCPVY
jgi:hypothetical protein